MKEFSIYEEELIEKLIEYDRSRNDWEKFIGIPVFYYISKVLSEMGIYISFEGDKIVFKYSIRVDAQPEATESLLNKQRAIIYIFHLINKLMQNNYIILLDLNPLAISDVRASSALYSVGDGLKIQKLAFDIQSIQNSFEKCLDRAIIVTDDLQELVKRNFNTIEQVRYEEELATTEKNHSQAMLEATEHHLEAMDKAQCQIRIAWFAFAVAIIAPIVTTCISKNDNTVMVESRRIEKQLDKIIDQTNISDTIQTKITNEILKVRPIKHK